MKKRTVAYLLLLSTAATGTVWAFGGERHADCERGPLKGPGPMEEGAMPMMPMSELPPPPPPGGPEPMMRALRELPEAQRAAARQLLDEGRGEELELRRQVVNERFELMKLGLNKEWDEQAMAQHTHKLAEALAGLELQRAHQHFRLRALLDEAPAQ